MHVQISSHVLSSIFVFKSHETSLLVKVHVEILTYILLLQIAFILVYLLIPMNSPKLQNIQRKVTQVELREILKIN